MNLQFIQKIGRYVNKASRKGVPQNDAVQRGKRRVRPPFFISQILTSGILLIMNPSTIDEYISAQSEAVRPILNKIRETIRAAAPNATEKIAWQMPTFWQGKNLIHFAAFKKHIGIYPGDLSQVPFEERLAGYSRTKGAIHFPLDKPVDYELIVDITRWRVSAVK